MTDLHLSNLSTLVPEAPYYAFYETRRQVYCGFDTDDMAFARTLIWYHTRKQIHTAHTGANRLTQIYINNTSYVLTAAICIEWMTHWYQKFTLQRFTISVLFKNYSLAEVRHLLIRFSKNSYFLWNTKILYGNRVNEQKSHTQHSEKGNRKV